MPFSILATKMDKRDITKLHILAGMWEGIQGSGVYHEEWSVESDDSLKGRAYLLKKGEIKNPESLKIVQDNGEVYYVAEVAHNSAPVKFRLTDSSDSIFVFENPDHDFPQKITYDLTVPDFLTAVIEAVNDGKLKQVEFSLKRTN